nr:MAG TPA: glycoprotein [Bacteriophage sp.]
MFNSTSPSLADIAAVTGNNRNDGAWGDGNGWWVLIILFAIFGGWGNGGWGNNGGGMNSTASAYTDSAIQRGFDNQAVLSKLDGITNGLCDGFYAQNTAIMNGFHGVDNAICNLGYQTQQGFNTTNVALMQGQNALQTQLANCCCETREAIQGVNYNMAQNTCALQNTMNSNTRDIIDSQNAGTRAILDYLCNEKISSLQAENSDLRRAASQDRQSALLTTQMAAQTQQIINAVNPSAIPAYVVPNPNAYAYGCGCNTGCGC